ncbi:hypothetical protein FQZ97_1030230 [compost metagenome]
MDLQRLAAEQHGDIRGLFAGDGELVHHLQRHILRHAFFPQACPIYARGLAFEDLHVISPNHLAVDIGQHPGQLGIGMLQHGVDAAYLVLGALAVMPGHDGLQDVAPVHRAFLIVGIGLRQRGISAGLLQPQLQLRLVGVQAHGSGGIRAADALLADLQPVLARQLLGADQAQGRAFLAGAAVQ